MIGKNHYTVIQFHCSYPCSLVRFGITELPDNGSFKLATMIRAIENSSHSRMQMDHYLRHNPLSILYHPYAPWVLPCGQVFSDADIRLQVRVRTEQ